MERGRVDQRSHWRLTRPATGGLRKHVDRACPSTSPLPGAAAASVPPDAARPSNVIEPPDGASVATGITVASAAAAIAKQAMATAAIKRVTLITYEANDNDRE